MQGERNFSEFPPGPKEQQPGRKPLTFPKNEASGQSPGEMVERIASNGQRDFPLGNEQNARQEDRLRHSRSHQPRAGILQVLTSGREDQ